MITRSPFHRMTDCPDWLRSRSERETLRFATRKLEDLHCDNTSATWLEQINSANLINNFQNFCYLLNWFWVWQGDGTLGALRMYKILKNEIDDVRIPKSVTLSGPSLQNRDRLQKVTVTGLQPKLSSHGMRQKPPGHGLWQISRSDIWLKSLISLKVSTNSRWLVNKT